MAAQPIIIFRPMSINSPIAVKAAFVFFVLLACQMPAVANDVVATISDLQGTLSAQHADGNAALLAESSAVFENDVLSTEANSYARLKFIDQSEVVLRPNSSLTIESFKYPNQQAELGSILLRLIKGSLRKITGEIGHKVPDQDQLITPVATIGIRGTHYGLLFCQDDCSEIPTVSGKPLANGLHVDVLEGAIALQNSGGELRVAAGEFAFVADPEHEPAQVSSQQGIQITIPPHIIPDSGHGNRPDPNHHNGQCTIP